MRNKLKINKNYFFIKELKITYIKSRVSEAIAQHIASRMRNIFLNSFLKIKDILLIINKVYNDFNRRYIA